MNGLVLWLNNGTWLVDGGYYWWPDSSSKHHDFGVGLTSQDPTVDPAALGGRDALRFTAASLTDMFFNPATTDFQWGTAPFVTEVVVNPGACTTPCAVWFASALGPAPDSVEILVSSADGGSAVVATAALTYVPVGNPAGKSQGSSAPFPSRQGHLLGVRRTGDTQAEVRVDGVAAPFTLPSGVTFQFPENGNLGGPLDGDLGEVVAAQSPSDADVAQLEAYLKAKFAL
jgi:hypothetical protein